MEEFGLAGCPRSQTVPNMSSLEREGEGEVTTPDSLLSDTKSPPDSPVTVSKTPDSALLSDRSQHRKTGNILLTAWQSAEQTEEAWSGMMDNENQAVRERLGHLERKVGLQNDEIVCLKATLAECLRRLNSLEVEKEHVEVCSVNTTPTRSVSEVVQHNGGGSKIPQRRPLSGCYTRRVSHQSEEKAGPLRRSALQLSSTSINSDTSTTTRVPLSSAPRLATPTGPVPRRMRGSMGKLQRRWRSTSDFDPAPPTLSVYRRSTAGGAGSSLSFRTGETSSVSPSPHSSQQNILGQTAAREPQFCRETGQLRFFISGRPVSLLCPESEREKYQLERSVRPPPPAQRLRLDWVYGYRGRDARANLHLLPTGEMIYFLAAVVVLYNSEERSQRHYLGHTEEIKCLAVHPNKTTVATGQGQSFYRREGLGEFKRAVTCLAFSRTDGGSFLLSLDESPEHRLVVWDWTRQAKQLESSCSSDTVLAAEFHPTEDGCIVSCGKGHVNFWQIEPSYRSVSRKTGVLDPRDKPKYFTCLAFSCTGDLITGDSNGNLLVWGRGYNAVTKAVWRAHEGPIFSVCVLKEDGGLVTGGGRDGRVVLYDQTFCPTGREAQLPPHLGSVRTISQGAGSQLLIGTTRNSVLTGSLELSFTEVMLGHVEEVTALAARPGQTGQFVTAGHDRQLHLWDSLGHNLVWSSDLGEQVQSVCFSPDGEVIVAATVTGKWVVLDSRTREVVSLHQDGAEPLTALSFSPDGTRLALISRASLQLYRVEENYRTYTRAGRCLAGAGLLPCLDWSRDSEHLQVNTLEREVVVVTASLGRILTDTQTSRNILWASSSCPLSWSTLGLWGGQETASLVCTGSQSAGLLVAGSDTSQLRLFSLPASQPQAGHHQYGGHSGVVSSIAFLPDQSRLVSVGGKDAAILQWQIE